jgi:hypothetical protein
MNTATRAHMLFVAAARMDAAALKGCHSVVPYAVDCWHTSNCRNGNATAVEPVQAAFNDDLAAAAHSRGLAVGLTGHRKLAPYHAQFDFGLTTHCDRAHCRLWAPLLNASKPVLVAESRHIAHLCRRLALGAAGPFASGNFSVILEDVGTNGTWIDCATVTAVPATATPTAPAATPAPAASQRYKLRLSGSHWQSVLASSYEQVRTSVRSDIATALTVPVAQITVNSLAVGSLVVDFTARALTADGTAPQWPSTAVTFPSTQSTYQTTSGSTETLEVLEVTTVGAHAEDGKGDDGREGATGVCESLCRVLIIMAVALLAAALIAVGAGAYTVMNRRRKMRLAAEADAEGEIEVHVMKDGSEDASPPPRYRCRPPQSSQSSRSRDDPDGAAASESSCDDDRPPRLVTPTAEILSPTNRARSALKNAVSSASDSEAAESQPESPVSPSRRVRFSFRRRQDGGGTGPNASAAADDPTSALPQTVVHIDSQ